MVVSLAHRKNGRTRALCGMKRKEPWIAGGGFVIAVVLRDVPENASEEEGGVGILCLKDEEDDKMTVEVAQVLSIDKPRACAILSLHPLSLFVFFGRFVFPLLLDVSQ